MTKSIFKILTVKNKRNKFDSTVRKHLLGIIIIFSYLLWKKGWPFNQRNIKTLFPKDT